MPKPDTSSLRPPTAVEDFRVYKEPLQGDLEIPIRFRVRKDLAKEIVRDQKLVEFADDYLYGRPIKDEKTGMPTGKRGVPAPFMVNTERVEITPELIVKAVALSLYEAPDEGEAAYEPKDWVGFSKTLPTVMEEAYQVLSDLIDKAGIKVKNS